MITDDSLTRLNTFQLTNNLTTQYVVVPIPYNTVSYGDIQLPKKTITSIISNVEGLVSVINLIDPNPGQVQQSDVAFRQAYIRKSYANARVITNAFESRILDDVEDVVSVRCYENDTDETDDLGRPPHSIEVMVDGGADEDIAKAIVAIRTGGIRLYGNVLVNVFGKYGDVLPVRFNRPEPVYIWIKVELDRGNNAIDPNYAEIVTDYIIENTSLSIGDSFLSQRYINGIYEALSGLMYCTIKSAVGSATTKPEATEFAEGNLSVTQRQKIILDAARIEVVLTS